MRLFRTIFPLQTESDQKVRLRPMLATLPVYKPGHRSPGAIKLSSNEMPYHPLPSVLVRIDEVAAEANRYPDSFALELTSALARKFKVNAEQVRVGCGSIALLDQLIQAVVEPGERVLFAWRSFEAYPIMATVNGAVPVPVPLSADHVHDLTAMSEQITPDVRLIFVCNPNNPTGTVVDRLKLKDFLSTVPPDVVVALDEAYREFVTDTEVPDGLDLLEEFPNLVVLRTFSKAYGLAGLRVGYAIAGDPALSEALRQTQLPFSITSIAQAAALACLEPAAENELSNRVLRVVAERNRVHTELSLIGYKPPPSHANFVWLPLGAATAKWAAECEQRQITLRAFDGVGARITIGTHSENDRLLAVASELRNLLPPTG
ncbi:histidinol-phosphate transaminase [Nocardia sp. CA-107356]|uniref:histidinol-phosphate transaminase n=1 Tax=Nocardia sp. CA-107356 TaxID=3239972 RepID=UPI003D93417A